MNFLFYKCIIIIIIIIILTLIKIDNNYTYNNINNKNY